MLVLRRLKADYEHSDPEEMLSYLICSRACARVADDSIPAI
jgi:hypothetical protein